MVLPCAIFSPYSHCNAQELVLRSGCAREPCARAMREVNELVNTFAVFGFTVALILDSPGAKVDRDLDVAELFSGVGSIHRAATEHGFKSDAFDKFRVPGVTDEAHGDLTEDITQMNGFLRALNLVMRLRPGGLLAMAPPCSSFVYMNSSKCKRTAANHYRGDENYKPVAVGNLIAEIAAFFLLLAHVRRVEACVENPPPSHMWQFPVMKEVIYSLRMSAVCTARCFWSTAPLGQRYAKPYILFSLLAVGFAEFSVRANAPVRSTAA